MTARAALLLVVASIVACTMRPAGPQRVDTAARGRLVVVPADATRPITDTPVLRVEVAATPERRQRGLGGRDGLPEDGGMLFVYPEDGPRRFWMKDCLIGLDIAFVDGSGRIVNLATLPAAAGLEDAKIPSAYAAAPVRWVLEAEAGWFARHRLGARDEVDLRAALVGVSPR